jgi:radical SAM protein with 4Fe4S-binding SPASM domain
MHLELMTNGLQIAAQAEEILAADFRSVSVSVDGEARVHDGLRRRQGCLAEVLRGTKILIVKGVKTGAVTQVNKLNLEALPFIHDMIVEHGFHGWMVQLTLPHGRAGERGREKSLCLEPEQLLRLEELLLDLVAREAIHFQLANTLGYMSRSEPRLRAGTTAGTRAWGACQAGLRAIGMTSDGTVRGCLSLPDAFDEGNIRERSLEEIWEDEKLFAYNRRFEVAMLEGPCRGCSFDRICRGGCPGLAWAATGKVGNNPYCLHALTRNR